jgi:hypothetical protein
MVKSSYEPPKRKRGRPRKEKKAANESNIDVSGITADDIRYLKYQLAPVEWVEENYDIKLDEWQKECLNSKSNRILLNCSRQSGKSTITSLMALHHALFTPKALVLVVSNIDIQAKETFKKIADSFHDLKTDWYQSEVDTVYEIRFNNKSRIIARTGNQPDSLRGYSGVTLLIIDEAATVNPESYMVLKPMLAVSKGKVVLLSTPRGKSGFFYDAYKDSQETNREGWHYLEIRAEDCPRITNEYLMGEKERFPDYVFEQEYHCVFVSNLSNIFPNVADLFVPMPEDDHWVFDLDELT